MAGRDIIVIGASAGGIQALRECRDRLGNSYRLRVRPYKNLENKIDGAVLALFEVDLREPAANQRTSFSVAERMFDVIEQPLLLLDASTTKIRRANRSFFERFGEAADQIEGRFIRDLHGDDRRVEKGVEFTFAHPGKRGRVNNAEPLSVDDGSPSLVLVTLQGIAE